MSDYPNAAARGEPGTWEHLVFWKHGSIDLGATLAGMPANDQDAAGVLKAEYAGELNYVPSFTTWHVWDQRCHRPDDSNTIAQRVQYLACRYERALSECKATVLNKASAAKPMPKPGEDREAYKAAITAWNDELNKAVEKAWAEWRPAATYAAGLKKAAGASNLEKVLAKACSVPPDEMTDRHPEVLNTKTGTVNLRTRTEYPHDPEDMLTYCLPLAYKPELELACPQFLALVHRMAGGNDEVAKYVLRVLGYALLGDNREQVIFFLNGPTKSGKSQVLYIVRQILGVLAEDSKADLITEVSNGRNARSENSIRGKRLVTVSETSARMRIDEGQVKRLTGEPVIAVDEHYRKDRIKTPVSWVIIVANNERDMPAVASMDSAIRERVIIIPCGPTIPVEQRDKTLAARILAAESEAILATLIRFASRYFTEGLPRPADVSAATERYCADQETVPTFVADTCATGCGWESAVPGIALLRAYRKWGEDLVLLGRNEFYTALAQVPGVTRDDNGPQVMFRGIAWKETVDLAQFM